MDAIVSIIEHLHLLEAIEPGVEGREIFLCQITVGDIHIGDPIKRRFLDQDDRRSSQF